MVASSLLLMRFAREYELEVVQAIRRKEAKEMRFAREYELEAYFALALLNYLSDAP